MTAVLPRGTSQRWEGGSRFWLSQQPHPRVCSWAGATSARKMWETTTGDVQHTARLFLTCKKTQGLFTCKKTHPNPKLPQNRSGRAGNSGESPLGAAVMGQRPGPQGAG